MTSYQQYFKTALSKVENTLHFAAHSHHLWPDISRNGQMDYWMDSATLADRKWGKIFSEVIPAVQNLIARELNLTFPRQISFAPNTHEFILRLFSCYNKKRPIRVLSTDSEFHSFNRQTKRMKEDNLIELINVSTAPIRSFENRFLDAAKENGHLDMIFFSHVFFNSGFVIQNLVNLVKEVREVQKDAIIVIDGYHGFCAIPTDLQPIEDEIFYLSGGYKYAASGEGVCFMYCPKKFMHLRPENTGWFADFEGLENSHTNAPIQYAHDGFRFSGATFDPSGLYRFRAVHEFFQKNKIDTMGRYMHVKLLQKAFLEVMKSHQIFSRPLISIEECGHFLTFALDKEKALKVIRELENRNLLFDHRMGQNENEVRIRFGFAMYHCQETVSILSTKLNFDF